MADLARAFGVAGSLVAALANFVVATVATLVHLLHLVLVLLQSCLIIVNYDLLFWASVTVGSGGLLTLRALHLALATSGTETLIINIISCIVVLTISFLLLRLHLQVFDVLFIVLMLLGLTHQLVCYLDALRGRIAHALDLSVIMLHFYFLEALVCDLADYVRVAVAAAHACLVRARDRLAADYLRRRFRRLRANFAGLGVLSAADGVGRVLHLHLWVPVMAVCRLLF